MFPRSTLLLVNLLAVAALVHPVVAVSVVVAPDKDHEKHQGISLSPRGTMQHAHEESFLRLEVMRREHTLREEAHPPTALVDESEPTYVPVPVNNAVPLPPVAAYNAIPLPAAPVQAAPQLPAAAPLPTLPAAQAAPASVALPAAGKELAATPPVQVTPIAVMAPSAPSAAVSGVAGHVQGNMTSAPNNPSADTAKKETKEVLNMVPQTKASALHVLLFGLSVTVALFTSGFVACFMQGRQDKRQHGEPFMPVGPAATRGRGKSSQSPSSRGAGSMHDRAPDAMHERDITTTAAQASDRDRLASPERASLDSCW